MVCVWEEDLGCIGISFWWYAEYRKEKKEISDSTYPMKIVFFFSCFLFVRRFSYSRFRLFRTPRTLFCLGKSLLCERVSPARRALCQNGLFDLETKRRRLMQLHHSRNERELQGKMVKAVEREQESRTSTALLFFWVVPVRRCTRDRQTDRCKI